MKLASVVLSTAAVLATSASAQQVYSSDAIKEMSVGELKRALTGAGLACDGCSEKAHFVELAMTELVGKPIPVAPISEEKAEEKKEEIKKEEIKKEEKQETKGKKEETTSEEDPYAAYKQMASEYADIAMKQGATAMDAAKKNAVHYGAIAYDMAKEYGSKGMSELCRFGRYSARQAVLLKANVMKTIEEYRAASSEKKEKDEKAEL